MSRTYSSSDNLVRLDLLLIHPEPGQAAQQFTTLPKQFTMHLLGCSNTRHYQNLINSHLSALSNLLKFFPQPSGIVTFGQIPYIVKLGRVQSPALSYLIRSLDIVSFGQFPQVPPKFSGHNTRMLHHPALKRHKQVA
jgi:hypothetical protein